jgi:hypothetical protein
MQSPEVIRRQWSGFGECRITLAPFETTVQSSLTDKIFAGLPRLLTRSGLGSLSFTIDPNWILQEKPNASPIVVKFLRVHRRALAEEWNARQRTAAVTVKPAPEPATQLLAPGEIPRRRKNDRIQPEATHARRQARGSSSGLPSWFESISQS